MFKQHFYVDPKLYCKDKIISKCILPVNISLSCVEVLHEEEEYCISSSNDIDYTSI